MQKGFAPIFILIGLIVTGIVATGGYYFYQQQQVKNINSFEDCQKAGYLVSITSESPSHSCKLPNGKIFTKNIGDKDQKKLQPPQASDSANLNETGEWKTYISEDEKFSIKYPANWNYEAKKTVVQVIYKEYKDAIFIQFGRQLSDEERQMQGYINLDEAPKVLNDVSLVYIASSDFQSMSLDDFAKGFIQANLDSKKDVTISNNIKALEVSYGCQAYCQDVIFKNNNTFYDFSTGPNAEAEISTLYQMLTTFKFLK